MSAPEVDAVTAPWWEATRQRRLLVQRCADCGAHQHYPRPLCLSCGGGAVEFVEAGGLGTVHSFTVVARAPAPEFSPPYVVALVDLAEGPRLLTRLVDVAEPRCDLPVTVAWEPLPDGRHLPVFTEAT